MPPIIVFAAALLFASCGASAFIGCDACIELGVPAAICIGPEPGCICAPGCA